ncbi:MAG: DUF47 family protein [Magnetospirillum sp. WYHS-4]
MKFIRALMPREERFVDHFAAHADRLVAAAGALSALMAAPAAERQERLQRVYAIEGEADVITREMLTALHRAFITPFDRSDVHALITAQDDTVDLIEDVAQHAELYKVAEFTPRMRELAAMIERAAKLVAEAMPLLHDITGNAARINGLCEQVSRIESEADHLLRRSLSELIEERPETIDFLGRKEVYELLEAVTDRCDDVADVIEGIVLDHV